MTIGIFPGWDQANQRSPKNKYQDKATNQWNKKDFLNYVNDEYYSKTLKPFVNRHDYTGFYKAINEIINRLRTALCNEPTMSVLKQYIDFLMLTKDITKMINYGYLLFGINDFIHEYTMEKPVNWTTV